MPRARVRRLVERITIERPGPVPIPIAAAGIGSPGDVLVITTTIPHGLEVGDYVTISGVDDVLGPVAVLAVVDPDVLTIALPASSPPLALGSPIAATVLFVSDAIGGRRATWSPLATVAAEAIPLSAIESLVPAALPAVASATRFKFRIYARADVSDQCRIRWSPTWPPDAPTRVLAITGILPDPSGRAFQLLDCAE